MADLQELIAGGVPERTTGPDLAGRTDEAITAIFGDRYRKDSKYSHRTNSLKDSPGFAGLLHEQSQSSGAYGGMSLVWFPIPETENTPASSLLTFVVGTRGLSPDEQILGRPGHVRHLQALRRLLRKRFDVYMWVKADPTNLTQDVPRMVSDRWPEFKETLAKYGKVIYAAVKVPSNEPARSYVTNAFLDLYAWERGWTPLKSATNDVDTLLDDIRREIFPRIDLNELNALVRERRFVVLQGPPGTGKTRLATKLRDEKFDRHGPVVQFHPAVTYETFVAGISPSVESSELSFNVKPGWLLEAVQSAKDQDTLFVIDEINRGDLGRVLGEAIYLFEPLEIARGESRTVKLPHAVEGADTLTIPQTLFILGTMNTADRSIAILDLAVRRRFAFVDIWPDLSVVHEQGIKFATEAFRRLQDIFIEHATEDALNLLPGHAYFLADTEEMLRRRLQYELAPLLREYLQEGRLGRFEHEVQAYLEWLDSELHSDGAEA